MTTQPLDRALFDARTLIRNHPPRWNSARKRRVFEIAKDSGHPFEGEVTYVVWREESLPPTVAARPSFAGAPGHLRVCSAGARHDCVAPEFGSILTCSSPTVHRSSLKTNCKSLNT